MASSVSLADVLSRYQLTEQQLDIPCPQEHLHEVTKYVGISQGRGLAYRLGVTEEEAVIVDTQDKYGTPLYEALFRKWQQKMGDRATYLCLAKGLEGEGCINSLGILCRLIQSTSAESNDCSLHEPSKQIPGGITKVKLEPTATVRIFPTLDKAIKKKTIAAYTEIFTALNKTSFKSSIGLKKMGLFLGGSIGQDTALPKHDLDITCYLSSMSHEDVLRKGYGELLGKIEENLKQELSSKYIHQCTTNVAIKFRYRFHSGEEIVVDLLLSPYWKTKHQYWRDLLKVSPTWHRYKTFSSGASKFQTALIKKEDFRVKIAIMRAKTWRNRSWEDDEAGRPKSYLMSLLVITAYYRAAGSAEKIQQLKLKEIGPKINQELIQMVEDIATGRMPRMDLREPSERWIVPLSKLPLPPYIIDPANPFNNLYLSGIASDRAKGEKKQLSEIMKEKQKMWEIFKEKITDIDITNTEWNKQK